MRKKWIAAAAAAAAAAVALAVILIIPSGAGVMSDEEAAIVEWAAARNLTTAADYESGAAVSVDVFIQALWKMLGSPEPLGDVPDGHGDDSPSMKWAATAGIQGTAETAFIQPGHTITRIQVLYSLYRLAGSPRNEGEIHFKDTQTTVYYRKALDWAFQNGLTDREAGSAFQPHRPCTQYMLYGFLYRYEQVVGPYREPVQTLGDCKWIAFGDSLTDNTGACYTGAPRKYHLLIAEATGIDVTVMGVGGTGYWKGSDTNQCFWQRMRKAQTDPDVDIVTIFGSVNDHTIYTGAYWNADHTVLNYSYVMNAGKTTSGVRSFNDFRLMSAQKALSDMTFEETISDGSKTYVAYVNECINAAHEAYPNAKIVLVNEIAFYNTKAAQLEYERLIKGALVAHRRAAGDDWLSIVQLDKSTFAGIDDPARKYVDTVAGMGLSFEQLSNTTFRSYYTYDAKGHPNNLYNRLWLAPEFANILCDAMGIDPETLPEELRID